MENREIKEKKLNKLMDVALIVMGIIIMFNIGYIVLNEYGNRVDSGVVMKMMYLGESDEPIREIIREEDWEGKGTEKEKLRAVSDWMYQNIRYPVGTLDDNDNAYDTLKKKVGNCLGQSHLAYIICRELDIEAYLLQFINGMIGHAVNIIRMEDGKGYYIMDTTIHYLGPADEYFRTYDRLGIDYSLPEYWAEELGL